MKISVTTVVSVIAIKDVNHFFAMIAYGRISIFAVKGVDILFYIYFRFLRLFFFVVLVCCGNV